MGGGWGGFGAGSEQPLLNMCPVVETRVDVKVRVEAPQKWPLGTSERRGGGGRGVRGD